MDNVHMWDLFRHPHGEELCLLGHSLIRFVINRIIFFLLIISTVKVVYYVCKYTTVHLFNWIYYLYTMFANGVNFWCLNIIALILYYSISTW